MIVKFSGDDLQQGRKKSSSFSAIFFWNIHESANLSSERVGGILSSRSKSTF